MNSGDSGADRVRGQSFVVKGSLLKGSRLKLRLRISGVRVQGLEFRVYGLGFEIRVWGSQLRIWDWGLTGYKSCPFGCNYLYGNPLYKHLPLKPRFPA